MTVTALREFVMIAAAATLAALLILMAFTRDAEAAMCGSHEAIQKILSDRYQESTRGLGLVSDRGIVELYISEKGTWSILMTMATGSSCIIAAGHNWQDMEAALTGPKA